MTTKTQLPQEWQKTTLGKIATYVNGRAFKPIEWSKAGTPIIRIQNLNNPNAEYNYYDGNIEQKYHVKNGDLLFAWSASLGAYIWKGENAFLNQHIFKVLPKENIDKTFIYYLLDKITNELYAKAHGSGMVHVTKGKFEATLVHIPPLETQTAIVNKIESLFAKIDAGIASLKTAQQQLKQYRQSLLKNAFNGELTKQWRLENADCLPSANELLAQIQAAREQHHAQQLADWQTAVKQWEQAGKQGKKPSKPKAPTQAVKFEEDFADLPNGWFNFALDELAEISGGLTKNSKRNSFEEKVPYLRVANVYANELKLDEIEKIGIQESEKSRTLLKYHDLLIVEGNGSIEQIGRVALWNDAINPCYHQNHLIKARCYPFVLPSFVLYFLMSPIGRERIINVASSTTGLHTLSLTKVANLIIPICSHAEQTQIVAILESKLTACDQLASELATQLKQAELLKQAVLKAAFEGKLIRDNHNE